MYVYSTRQIPLSRRRQARLDRHAANQRKHVAKKKAAGVPDREDFGRAAIHCCLALYHRDPTERRAASLRQGIILTLVDFGFDRRQTEITYAEMAARASRDLEAWKRKRVFEKQRPQ
jgi:hypothetical protein